MSATSRKSSIQFAGAPSNLTAKTDLSLVNVINAYVIVAGEQYPLRFVADGNTIRSLAFSMPDNTLPCSLEIDVFIDDFSCSATALVAVHPKVVVAPPAITLQASAGEQLSEILSVTNCGNSELTISADTAVTLRPSGKLGRNIAKALKHTDRDIADRLIHLGELMKKEQHHELSVSTRTRPAKLALNKTTQIVLELGVPEDIDTSTTWTGSFALSGTRVRVSLEPRPASRSASR